jgi:hypothetical protein
MASQRGAKAPKFYIISWSFRHGLADFEVENQKILVAASGALHPPSTLGAYALYPPPGRRGFPVYPEKPRVVIGKRKKGPPPSDIELYHSYWLISDRLKSLFESVDPQAFAFQPCDVKLRDGSPGPVYWLCDVVRVLEAFGEATVQEFRSGTKHAGLKGDKTLVFNESAIGDSHIFRTPYSPANVFCDQVMKDACKAAGMKGVQFHDCSPKRKLVTPPVIGPNPRLDGLSNRLLAFGDNAKAASLAIAARSALRAIPLLARLSWDKPLRKRMRAALGRPRMSNSAIVLGTFRSAATAWVAARFHAFGMSKRFDEIKHHARMAGSEDAGKTAGSSAAFAAHSAMMAAISVFHDGRWFNEIQLRAQSARTASLTVAIVSHGFMGAYDPQATERFHQSRDPNWIKERELTEAERVIWDAAWEDIRQLESNDDNTQSLLMQPLWLIPAPQNVRDDWQNLAARLFQHANEHWNVWIDWFEARLAGRAELSETDEIARVSLPNEIWTRGPPVANARLSGLEV